MADRFDPFSDDDQPFEVVQRVDRSPRWSILIAIIFIAGTLVLLFTIKDDWGDEHTSQVPDDPPAPLIESEIKPAEKKKSPQFDQVLDTALTYERQGNRILADALFLELLNQADSFSSDDHRLVLVLSNAARFYIDGNEMSKKEIEQLFLRAIEAMERIHGKNYYDLENMYRGLEEHYVSMQRYQEAAVQIQKLIDFYHHYYENDNNVIYSVVSPALIRLGNIKLQAGQVIDAHNAYKKALVMRQARNLPTTGIMELMKQTYSTNTKSGPVESGNQNMPEPGITGSGIPLEMKITINNNSFQPVEFKGPAMYSPANIQLSKVRYSEIRKEPDYRGKEQWYGHMDLGNQKNKRFYFVLNLQTNGKFILYFDKNKNNDLTDDGEPLVNSGSGAGGPGGFACKISIPWQVLIENSPYAGDYNIWFFSNEANWKHQSVSHYSRTQLQGSVKVNNNDYLALIIDQGYNDADLSNDGIALDLNGNNTIDDQERPRKTHDIAGNEVTFDISWLSGH